MHVILFVTLLTCATATALYDDQIGKFDWKKEFVGDVIAVDFESSISVSKYVFVATKLNAVACFNTRTGRIEWRKILSEKDGHVIGIKHTKEGLLGVTSGGIAHLWETSSGSLKWEANLATSAEKGEEYTAHAFAVLERTYSEGNLLVVLSSNGIHTVPLSKHNPSVETVAFEDGGNVFNPALNKIFVDSNNGKIVHLVLTPSSRLSVNIYDAKELASGAKVTVETPWLDSLDMSLLLEDNQLIYISAETQSFYLVDLTQGTTKLTSSYAGLGVQEVTGLVGVSDTDLANHGSEFIVIQSSNQISQITVEDKEALKVKWNQHVENLQNVEIKQLGAEVYVFVATVDNSLLSVTATNLKTGSVDENSILTHKLENKDAGIEKIYINMFLKRSTPIGFRLLVKSDDSSVMLVAHPNRVMWRRHESLAEIVDAAMIDLPLSDADAGIEAEFDESSTTKRPMLAGMFAKVGRLMIVLCKCDLLLGMHNIEFRIFEIRISRDSNLYKQFNKNS